MCWYFGLTRWVIDRLRASVSVRDVRPVFGATGARLHGPRGAWLLLLLGAGLAACSEGGDALDILGVSQAIELEGVVMKSAVTGAKVCADWLDPAGRSQVPRVCTWTDQKGRYRLAVTRRTGVLEVTARGGSYRDDVNPSMRFGLTQLRSVVVVDASLALGRTVNITALTELAALRLASLGAIDAASVALATTQVEQAFGVPGLARTPVADLTTWVDIQDTPALLYGLANAGVLGWMAERGWPAGALDEGLRELAQRLAAGTLYQELVSYRAGMRRVLLANPATGLHTMAPAWSALVPLDFGARPPGPSEPAWVEQPATLRYAVRWNITDLFGGPAPMCVTNVPLGTPLATVWRVAQRAAERYGQQLTGLDAIERCRGAAQSVTVDFMNPESHVWGDGT